MLQSGKLNKRSVRKLLTPSRVTLTTLIKLRPSKPLWFRTVLTHPQPSKLHRYMTLCGRNRMPRQPQDKRRARLNGSSLLTVQILLNVCCTMTAYLRIKKKNVSASSFAKKGTHRFTGARSSVSVASKQRMRCLVLRASTPNSVRHYWIKYWLIQPSRISIVGLLSCSTRTQRLATRR